MLSKKIAKALGAIVDRAVIAITNGLVKGVEEVYRWSSHLSGASSSDNQVIDDLTRVSAMYMEAERARAKAQLLKGLSDTIKNEGSVTAVVQDILEAAKGNLSRVIENEINTAKNLGALEGIVESNPGVSDPQMFWLCVHDDKLCGECERLHLMPDGFTPKVWKVSEVQHGYHKRGETQPKFGGLHPNERCTPATILPGYGFVGGHLRWIGPDHDEWATQRAQNDNLSQ